MVSAQANESLGDYKGLLKSHTMTIFFGSSTRILPIPSPDLPEDDFPPLKCPKGSTKMRNTRGAIFWGVKYDFSPIHTRSSRKKNKGPEIKDGVSDK